MAVVPYLIVPTSPAPAQAISVNLNNQAAIIRLYTRSINMPLVSTPGAPPQYQNVTPVFVDLDVAAVNIVTAVWVRNQSLIVRDTYLGFSGDLVVFDAAGLGEDPFGIPPLLPPPELQTPFQRSFPLSLNGRAPPNLAGTIFGMGTRFLLTYWPPGTYTPGYPPPPTPYPFPPSS